MSKRVYLLVENEEGQYKGKDGKRYNVIEAGWVVGPRADEFVEFESLEEAAAFYGLTKIEEEGDYDRQ